MTFGAAQNPQTGRKPHASLRPPPPLVACPHPQNLESGTPLDPHPQLIPPPPGIPPQCWLIRPVIPLGPNRNHRVGSQASLPIELVPNPSRLRIPEPRPRPLVATRKKPCQYKLTKSLRTQNSETQRLLQHAPLTEDTPHLQHSSRPQTRKLTLSRTPSLNLDSDSPPETCPCLTPRVPASVPADQACHSPWP